MTKEEALAKVRGYLTDYLSKEDSWEIEEIMKALGDDSYIFEKMGRETKELGK
jgi:hypothetical protein